MLVSFLERLGYRATGAATASEAMDTVVREDGNIDILVADVQLEDSNGPELARRIAERWPKMSVLFVSGAAHPDEHTTESRKAAQSFLPSRSPRGNSRERSGCSLIALCPKLRRRIYVEIAIRQWNLRS